MAYPFQRNAFQQNAFDTGTVDDAFQPGAFQVDAFQTSPGEVVVPFVPKSIPIFAGGDDDDDYLSEWLEKQAAKRRLVAEIEAEDMLIMEFVETFLIWREAA